AWLEAGRLSALGRAPEPRSISMRPRVWPFAIAASVLLAIGVALFVSRDSIFATNRYSTVVGGLPTIPPADGSKVPSNTDSQVRLAITDRERAIELTHGEAFFEVARDPSRPFVVTAGSKRVIAVGTQFSVRRDGEDVQVAVAEGLVRVESLQDSP